MLLCTLSSLEGSSQSVKQDGVEIRMLLDLGKAHLEKEVLDSAAFYYLKAQKLAIKRGDKKGIYEATQTYLRLLNSQGKYKDALPHSEALLALGKTMSSKEEAIANHTLGIIHANLGNLETSTTYFVEAFRLAESLDDQHQQLVIANNQLELKKKNNFIFLSLAALVALVLVLLNFYVLYRNKQRAAFEKLRAWERENELRVLMTMLEGEEKERSRLARELHDGVGGTLSATKMHLSLLRKHNSIPEGTLATLEKSLGLIDSAAQEIRTISHNLSPEILQHYDLATAIANFCQSVAHEALQVDFYNLGDPLPLKNHFRLIIYRIVQELVSNILKHAQATHALVQLSQHDQLLSLTVEDNGKGFEIKEAGGIGLVNLHARVKDMGGHITIESLPGAGTTIYLEFDATPFLEKQSLVSTTT